MLLSPLSCRFLDMCPGQVNTSDHPTTIGNPEISPSESQWIDDHRQCNLSLPWYQDRAHDFNPVPQKRIARLQHEKSLQAQNTSESLPRTNSRDLYYIYICIYIHTLHYIHTYIYIYIHTIYMCIALSMCFITTTIFASYSPGWTSRTPNKWHHPTPPADDFHTTQIQLKFSQTHLVKHQWPFQDPKLEVTIYKAYFLGHSISGKIP